MVRKISYIGVILLSGGGGKVDPYYQKPLFKPTKSYPKPPIQLPSRIPSEDEKVLPIPPELMKRIQAVGKQSPLYWYDCDGCGKLFPSSYKRRAQNTFCGNPECIKQHRQKLFGGKPHSEDQKKKQSKILKKKYENPDYRARLRRIHQNPELNKRRSKAHKKRWVGKRKKRDSIDDQIRAFYTSSDWRKQSKRVQKRDNYTCQACGRKKSDIKCLNGHHVYRLRSWIEDGNEPEDYPDELVVPLCEKCHPSTDSQEGDWRPPKSPSDNA
jgi:5-methylcytosine-specific restriction endonuclease McrA